MPELPDVTIYVERIAEHIVGRELREVRLQSPFVLRTASPPITDARRRKVESVNRLGKRIVLCLVDEYYLIIHLMIAGRFRWGEGVLAMPRRLGLAAFDFENGCLLLTEAGTRKRASIHFVQGHERLALFDRGGVEISAIELDGFVAAMTHERHTLKRALTDPRIVSGVGNAYSDEILHRARLSPLQMTDKLDAEGYRRLFDSCRHVLAEFTTRLREESMHKFPEHVTAFRDDMAVHGRYGKACPVCGAKVQRIVYASNETNYCPECQTGGRLLADRSLSRLLREDWPKTPDELEERRSGLTEKRRSD